MFEISDTQKIGVGLTGFGMLFLLLGTLMLFDRSLLALGNILFIAGMACVTGFERTYRFFFQRHKIRGSLAFFGGIFLVLYGFPVIGMLIEIYGFFMLFSLSYNMEEVKELAAERLTSVMCNSLCDARTGPRSGFFPVAINFLRRIPFLGRLLSVPGISTVVEKLDGSSGRTSV